MLQQLIARYKRLRTEHFLRQTFQCSYAFVGMGQHSLTNLYPVLSHLGVRLKYICVATERKARLIAHRYPATRVTTSLAEVLGDDEVRGVFVATSPSAHYPIALQVLQSGKSLFVEKPPCTSLAQLDSLISARQRHGSSVAMVGLQQRYAPAVVTLRKRLCREHLVSYDLHYLTGAYPEGDALLDLFIHPLDLVVHLFGKPEVIACQQVGPGGMLLMLRHHSITGTLELSTAYAWTTAEERLTVHSTAGIYQLSMPDELAFEPLPRSVGGIPTEKLWTRGRTTQHLHCRSMQPVMACNTVYTQGYYGEIERFLHAVEGRPSHIATSLEDVRDTYQLIGELWPR